MNVSCLYMLGKTHLLTDYSGFVPRVGDSVLLASREDSNNNLPFKVSKVTVIPDTITPGATVSPSSQIVIELFEDDGKW